MANIEVRDLRVVVEATGAEIVRGVDFTLEAGEILGLVGESGSGKTTVATAMLGHARRGAKIVGGSVRIAGKDVLTATQSELAQIRGRVVAYVPQDPGTALNPALRIGTQIVELLKYHRPDLRKSERRPIIVEAMQDVRLPADESFLRRFPHQLSGGQQQRVCIAMAFLLRPAAIILDEPTTGLDVTTQAHVLKTVKDLCVQRGVSAVYVSHDLAVVSELADHVMVMYAGLDVELGDQAAVLGSARHPYTQGLIAAIPDARQSRVLSAIPGTAPGPGKTVGCAFASRCPYAAEECNTIEPESIQVGPGHSARCLRLDVVPRTLSVTVAGQAMEPSTAPQLLTLNDVSCGYGGRTVVKNVNLGVYPGECLALVGESGSGKTTLARAIVGLIGERDGDILYEGRALELRPAQRSPLVRKDIQYIFQSPYASLNPRRTIRQIVRDHIRQNFPRESSRQVRERVERAISRVGLPARVLSMLPNQLSGGERQRVAIARAIGCEPRVLICDEITSALDVSVQAAVVNLLQELRSDGLSLVFVTHNLALVRTIADRIAVMKSGEIIELATTGSLLDSPTEEYTR
ncbi:ABC transporter ATP-binding protein [Microbacterium deminutum]|uniref:ABC transporter ATP-binding protein n=1 Tax=Microbacterium deminutum TaxID=344164 RepID=A0ABP5CUW6_9MICO